MDAKKADMVKRDIQREKVSLHCDDGTVISFYMHACRVVRASGSMWSSDMPICRVCMKLGADVGLLCCGPACMWMQWCQPKQKEAENAPVSNCHLHLLPDRTSIQGQPIFCRCCAMVIFPAGARR